LSQAIKDDTSFARDNIPILQTNVETIQETQSQQLATQKLQQHNIMMQWLSPVDFSAQQNDIISRRQEGTGQWLLDSPEFKEWLQGSEKTLFCPGIPGAGKTMMAAIAIDHLSRLAQKDVGLAYLFCNYKTQLDQNLPSLLIALLKQLVRSRPDIAAPVTLLYDHHSKQQSRPSRDELFTALSTVCSNYTTVYIVVDALDECMDQDGVQTKLVKRLRELQTMTEVRLLFTSRFIPDIIEEFRSDPILEVRASKVDVTRFITGQWSRLPKYDEQLKRTIQDRIVDTVEGM
jgi:hypothetical protein